MKKSRFTESQIVSFLKEADAGLMVAEICRKHGISHATYYNWKAKYGGMSAVEYIVVGSWSKRKNKASGGTTFNPESHNRMLTSSDITGPRVTAS